MKVNEIQKFYQQLHNHQNLQQVQHLTSLTFQHYHLVRAILIIIDTTQSMTMKDFKPSRLSVSLQMVKSFIKKAKDQTPIVKFAIGVVCQQQCKLLCRFVYRESELTDKIDQIKIIQDPGFFSLENCLSVSIDCFKKIPSYFHKEIFLIQSSPSTKDNRDIYQTIQFFQKTSISINIASLVGETFVFKKLVDKCSGKYEIMSSNEKFQQFVDLISRPPKHQSNSDHFELINLSLCQKKNFDPHQRCYCCFKKSKDFYVCGKCKGILCKKPAMECPICMTILVFPQDLFRHKTIL